MFSCFRFFPILLSIVIDDWLVCCRIIKGISKDDCNRQRKFIKYYKMSNDQDTWGISAGKQISNSAFCQFVIEFLSGTLHVSQALLITQARIKCNTFPAVLLCTFSAFDKFELTGLICNGNRTEWSPIRSVIIRVITKSDDRAAGVRFVYHEYDYRPNWTTRSPIAN